MGLIIPNPYRFLIPTFWSFLSVIDNVWTKNKEIFVDFNQTILPFNTFRHHMSILPTSCHYINQYYDVLYQSFDNLVHIYNRYVDSPLQQSIHHDDSINTVNEL
jgi:hypothetical protein